MMPESPYEKVEQDQTMTLEERVVYLERAVENAFNTVRKEIQTRDQRNVEEKQAHEAQLSQALSMVNLTLIQCVVTNSKILSALEAKGVLSSDLREEIKTEIEQAIMKQQELVTEYMDSLKDTESQAVN